jgi:F1F0 ATPase subunit 2
MSVSSFFGRLAVVFFGFYYGTGGRWERLIACLAGFLVVRIVVVRRWGPARED